MKGLSEAYNGGLQDYFWDVGLSSLHFDTVTQVIEYIDNTIGANDVALEFMNSVKLKQQEFVIRKRILQDQANLFRQKFINEGPPLIGSFDPGNSALSSPSLSPGNIGDTDTLFQFHVIYSHSNNYVPNYVRVVINNISYEMHKVNPSDSNYTDGVEYRFTSSFQIGDYYYYFEASDGFNIAQAGYSGNYHFQVHTKPAGDISITASPNSIPMDGNSCAEILVAVIDSYGNPIPGKMVEFSSNYNYSFNPIRAYTNPSGIATTQFTPGNLGILNLGARQ
jgi:hypothetical protein